MCGLLSGPQKSGRNNGVVGLTGFSNERMCGLCSGHKKMAVIEGWSYGGVPLNSQSCTKQTPSGNAVVPAYYVMST